MKWKIGQSPLPLAQRQIHALGFVQSDRNNPMATVTQTATILSKMIADCVGTVTDINGRRGTSNSVKKQDGEQKGFHKKGLGVTNAFYFITLSPANPAFQEQK